MVDAETFDAILTGVGAGEPVRRVLCEVKVNPRVFYAYLRANDDAAKRYAREKDNGLDALADEIIQIADESRRGVKTTTKADGSTETVDGDMVDRARLQIDSRKWLLSKLAPKKYGDKLGVEHDLAEGFAEKLLRAKERANAG